MDNSNALDQSSEFENESFDLDELQKLLESELGEQFSDLELLEEERKKIGNPESLGKIIQDTVLEHINNQIAGFGAEEFIEKNKGLEFDPRNSAHIQTTENFANGKIATHNSDIDYQERYDQWQSNFKKDENSEIVTYLDRSGKRQEILVKGARNNFDKGRATGSIEKNTDMDHTISAAEIIRDSDTNAHLSVDEQIKFANSSANLNEMNSSHNRSKKDNSMTDWLDNPNSSGVKPKDNPNIGFVTEEQDKEYRKNDKIAREEYKKVKKEGEAKSIETGKKSQKQEIGRMGIEAGKAIGAQFIMKLLKDLLAEIIRNLIAWFKSANKKIDSFLDAMKIAIKSFVNKLKNEIGKHIKDALSIGVKVIVGAIFKPIARIIRKFGAIISQGFNSIKNAVDYLRNPENKNVPFSIKVAQVGKIVVAGLAATGAIFGGQLIESGLSAIPVVGQVLAFEIPLIGSLSSLIGLFMGALVSGVLGALVLRWIDKFIAKRLENEVINQQFDKRNEILDTQNKLIHVTVANTEQQKQKSFNNIVERHNVANEIVKDAVANIFDETKINIIRRTENDDDLDDLFNDIKKL